jgi:hypothetical protein
VGTAMPILRPAALDDEEALHVVIAGHQAREGLPDRRRATGYYAQAPERLEVSSGRVRPTT